MKNASQLTIAELIRERLAAIGSDNIPNTVREELTAEAGQACARTIDRKLTVPRVARAVAIALGKDTNTKANEGQMLLFPEV